MSAVDGKKTEKKLSDIIRIPWVKGPAALGLVAAIVGLTTILMLKTLDFSVEQLLPDVKAFFDNYGIVGVFIATILAGTVIPLGSPALVIVAASFGLPPIALIIVATTGFTIGMTINYGLAYRLGRSYVVKKLGENKLEDISNLWGKWGWIIYIIFGTIPVLPVELLSLFCGLLKTRFDIFLVLTFISRFILFTVLVYFGEHIGVWLGIT
ncbi:DedA family protein [Candidatus Bathyarchaeota archaeon]|nr:DedA family protein [Candidatus Bathyarchaeota archaeon]MBS7613033.1 DedA family protein [Candidatus Bathyarchaeota archaeon]MBS7617625.1 DedA family protein [Candidatus Bathyarchaeota archaeon]